VVFAHGQAGGAKLAQAAAYGARVLRIDSPAPSVVFDVCRAACARWGWRHLSTAGMYDPYTVEGAKTIAYELWQQYAGALPEWIVLPVGGGGLLGGVWRGVLDLQRLGLIERLPRIVGVQAAGCAPLKRAIDGGESFLESLKQPWPNPKTIAGGIADDILFDGHTALPAIRTTNGLALAVEDRAIEEGIALLARNEGLYCEASSGVVVAALEELTRHAAGQRVCLVVTGHGMKDFDRRNKDDLGPLLEGNLGAIAAAIASNSTLTLR
jgi:threonine synthase